MIECLKHLVASRYPNGRRDIFGRDESRFTARHDGPTHSDASGFDGFKGGQPVALFSGVRPRISAKICEPR